MPEFEKNESSASMLKGLRRDGGKIREVSLCHPAIARELFHQAYHCVALYAAGQSSANCWMSVGELVASLNKGASTWFSGDTLLKNAANDIQGMKSARVELVELSALVWSYQSGYPVYLVSKRMKSLRILVEKSWNYLAAYGVLIDAKEVLQLLSHLEHCEVAYLTTDPEVVPQPLIANYSRVGASAC